MDNNNFTSFSINFYEQDNQYNALLWDVWEANANRDIYILIRLKTDRFPNKWIIMKLTFPSQILKIWNLSNIESLIIWQPIRQWVFNIHANSKSQLHIFGISSASTINILEKGRKKWRDFILKKWRFEKYYLLIYALFTSLIEIWLIKNKI